MAKKKKEESGIMKMVREMALDMFPELDNDRKYMLVGYSLGLAAGQMIAENKEMEIEK